MFTSYDFFLIWILTVLLIFSVAIWIEKMIKIIIWNYLLIWIALSLHVWIDLLVDFLSLNSVAFLSDQENLVSVFSNYKQHIVVSIYMILLILLFSRSKIWIWVSSNSIIRFIYWIIFAPIAVLSIISSLVIVIFGIKVFSYEWILELLSVFEEGSIVYLFFIFLPLWVILPAFISLLLSTEIRLFKRKAKSLNTKKETNDDHKDSELKEKND